MKKTAAILFASLFLFSCRQSDKTSHGTSKMNTAKQPAGKGATTLAHALNKDSANIMLESYITSVGDNDTALKSLIFDAGELRDYLSNENIKHVKIMFAHTLGFINAGNTGKNAYYHPGELTVIIAGYDSDNNYVYWNGDNVMDKCLPCPNVCPPTGDASSNLLE